MADNLVPQLWTSAHSPSKAVRRSLSPAPDDEHGGAEADLRPDFYFRCAHVCKVAHGIVAQVVGHGYPQAAAAARTLVFQDEGRDLAALANARAIPQEEAGCGTCRLMRKTYQIHLHKQDMSLCVQHALLCSSVETSLQEKADLSLIEDLDKTAGSERLKTPAAGKGGQGR